MPRAKAMPESFQLSDVERAELDARVTKRQLLATQFEMIRQSVHTQIRDLEMEHVAWANRVGKRLGIPPEQLVRYRMDIRSGNCGLMVPPAEAAPAP